MRNPGVYRESGFLKHKPTSRSLRLGAFALITMCKNNN